MDIHDDSQDEITGLWWGTEDKSVFLGVFRKCLTCNKDVLVMWHEDPAEIKGPQSCKDHN